MEQGDPKLDELFFSQSDVVFEPRLDGFSIGLKRIKHFIFRLFFFSLVLFGTFGILGLAFYFFFFGLESARTFLPTFYLSLWADMFFYYIRERQKEKFSSIIFSPHDTSVEISRFLDEALVHSLEKSWIFCHRHGYHFLRPIHLFYILIRQKNFEKVLKRLNAEPKAVIQKTRKILNNSSFVPDSERGPSLSGPKIAVEMKKIFGAAYDFCVKEKIAQIGHLEILWAMSQEPNLVGLIFDEFGIEPEEIKRAALWAMVEKEIQAQEKSFFWRAFFKPKGKLDRAMTASLTPWLDKMSRDLTGLSRMEEFELVLGRDREIDDIFNFFGSGQAAVLLTGEDKVGKTAILKKIAELMLKESVPDFLKDKRLVQLDIASLVGLKEANQRGEEYFKAALSEVSQARNIVLVIENLDQLMGLKSGESGLEFSEILSLALEGRSFYFIGTSSLSGLAKIEGSGLNRYLGHLKITDPAKNLLWLILISKIVVLEKKLKVVFAVDALEEAVNLAERYLYGKALTAKAMDLLIEAGYKKAQDKKSDGVVNDKDIAILVAEKTQIPLTQIREMEKEKLLNLEEIIHQRLVNQEEAVKAVSNALRRSFLGAKERRRPIANFLFVGPTGVGKTELAKSLAWAYFGGEQRMIRLDMSEYQEKRTMRRLIGDGTGRTAEKGYLTEKIKRQPYSLLLLDELEKAHKDILNVFLQVMDDGRLTDASGETVDFSNVILIATSNAGTRFIQDKIKDSVGYEDISRELKTKVLQEYFLPEFLNRFDEIVLFRPLTISNLTAITYLFLKEIKNKLETKGLIFEAEQEAAEELGRAGFDPLYGARNLRRLIQDKVESPLSELLLKEDLLPRDRIVLRKGLILESERAMRI